MAAARAADSGGARWVRLARCVGAADRLIEDLRRLELGGVDRVPEAWQEQLDRFPCP